MPTLLAITYLANHSPFGSYRTLPYSAYHLGDGEGPSKMMQFLRNIVADDSGQDLIEYALVAALVGLGAVAAMKGLSNSVKNSFNGVGTSLTNA